MPIQNCLTQQRRTTANRYDVSRWTAPASTQHLYRTLDEASDQGMMKSDALLFRPGEMLSGTGLSNTQFDPSYARFHCEQMKPTWMLAGGFVAFLLIMRYLTSSK